MTKAILTRTWGVLHVGAAVVSAAALDRLLVDLGADGVTRVLVVVAGLLAWAALGALGVLLATAVRDGMRLGRRLRLVVTDLADRQSGLARGQGELRRDVTDVRDGLARVTEEISRGTVAHEATAAANEATAAAHGATAEAVEALGARVDRLEGGLEQLGRDMAGSLRAQVERLDDLAARRPRGEERDAPR